MLTWEDKILELLGDNPKTKKKFLESVYSMMQRFNREPTAAQQVIIETMYNGRLKNRWKEISGC